MRRFFVRNLIFALTLVFVSMTLYAQGSESVAELATGQSVASLGAVSTDVEIRDDLPVVVGNSYLLREGVGGKTFRIFSPEEGINFLIDGSEYVEKNPAELARLESDRRYDIYIERIDEVTHLRGISGLRSLAEIKEDQRIAEEKRAWEEANRFNPSDFHFVSENFLPAMYSTVDLSYAMERSSRAGFKEGFYISDVTAVAQYGKAIYVKSPDKTSSKVMTINGRGNIRENERIRIYYSLSKDEEDYVEWEISAIKILSAGS
ncbi:MAG: hypothetical protein VZR56_01225 [Treponema sp.]|nr:hypothetical protein [Treponema sp.]